ncbi:hypothetical protein GCM10007933_22980 [Zoogloea oryzae]|uniref:DUF927 domain-containing protein n=1 Tax=Zoogloea oryzae TaxID=310767 RepID=A0ABQ6FBA5_9RHOO|nr:DUF927 domain-containing protein [Zoogloea oryzae]GLT22837.1 hypothetical protein GCM10007933_22980 [Zoogloea oryzae]
MNEYDILAQFRSAAEARGLRLPDRLDADGKLHRCPLQDGPAVKKDGAWLLHLDGVPAGGFENHRDGLGWQAWKADIRRQLTPEEEAAHRARMDAHRVEREAEAKKKRDLARRKANAIWSGARPAPDDHLYLQRKGVQSFGLRAGTWPKWVQDHAGRWEETHVPGVLLVPMRSPSGTLHSLQAIYPEKVDGRDKDFLPHGEKVGKSHLIGEPAEGLPLCVAEGYATAASIHLATGWPVAVAFDAGSLEAVARALHQAHPAACFILCADDDAFGECFACQAPVRVADGDTCPACGQPHKRRNAGQLRAQEAARAVGGVVASPAWPDPAGRWEHYQATRKAPTDFNDLHQLAGLDAVRTILEAATASFAAPQGDEAPSATPTAPDAETPAACPKTAPAASLDEAAKPVKRSRSKAKGKGQGAQPHAQGGELFELREGNDGRGVYRLKVERRGEGWETVEQFVCAPLEITHMVRDARGEGWCRLAVFNDHDGRRRRVLLPDEMLDGDGTALAKLLRAQGLFIGDNKNGLLKMHINRSRPNARARVTSRIGWHEDVTAAGRWSYVLGGDADPLAPAEAELWLHQANGTGHAQFKQSGTLDDWRANVGALAVGNSRLTFALSAAFAGGLCWLHPNVSGGFHWAGGSSLGKSALLYSAASLCGPASYRRTWLLTATAIEGVAAGHCDAPLLLDELKQAGNPRDVAQAAYMLTSGQGKGRGQAAGGLRETASFSLLFQSNGEIGLTQFLEENQERAYAGQEVRFCELPADAGAGFGCWDVLHGLPDGARFSETLQRNAAKHYGTAYPEFIRRVIAEREAMPQQFEELRRAFEARALSDKAGGQAIRAATRFAAVAYAGEKATEWALTGWPQGEAIKAAFRMFKDWLHAFGGEENREPRKMVEQVQAWIQAHAGARLEDWRRPSISDTHAPRTMNRAGWKRPTKETASLNEPDHVFEYLIYPTVFKGELCSGFDPAQVTRELVKRGLLVSSKDGQGVRHQIKVREPGAGGTSWMVCISPSILEWCGDEG